MNIQTIKNVEDCKALYLPHSLYLKPVAKIHISVALPTSITGKTISNWDVMEKLRNLNLPDTFSVLRVSKTTIEFIRLEAEVEDRGHLKRVLGRLDGASIKLSGFSEGVRVRASEPKDDFPTRHDWDSFFRDARNMDEMKAGERPDTVYISNLPIKWFCPRHQVNADHPKPSENIFKRIFEKFGDVRVVDIPICDPYRGQMKSTMTGLKTFSVDNETYFEGYVQFNEYLGFVKAMDDFRGMKLVHKEGELSQAISIIVDFDKTKHLSDNSIKRRSVVRDRLMAKEREQEEIDRKRKEVEDLKKKKELEKLEEIKRKELEKQKQREERRKQKQLKKLKEKENLDFQSKIKAEEKKLLQAQRKLESIRLLEALFARIKMKTDDQNGAGDKKDANKRSAKERDAGKSKKPMDLRDKLISKYKNAHQDEFKKRQDTVKKAREGKVLLTELLASETKRSPSIDSISSNDSIFSDSEAAKKKKKKRSNSSSSSSSGSSKASKESHKKETTQTAPGIFPPQGFHPSMYNPEMGDWFNMYAYGAAPYFPPNGPPTMAPVYFPSNGYNPNFRGRGRGRGRGFYRGNRYRDYDRGYDRYNSHERRRSRSRSRSRTRSRSKSRSSRSPRRRNRSRRRSLSHSGPRTSRKLASTLRNRNTPSSDESRCRSRSRSRSRHRSRGRSWSRSRRHRSRSSSSSDSSRSRGRRSRSRSRNHKSESRAKDRSKEGSKEQNNKEHTPPPKDIEQEKLVSEERNIRKDSDETPQKGEEVAKAPSPSAPTRKRSKSIDSAKFLSPRRREKSQTPTWSK